MAELNGVEQYEGLWSFMDADGDEQGPFNVQELNEGLDRCRLFPFMMLAIATLDHAIIAGCIGADPACLKPLPSPVDKLGAVCHGGGYINWCTCSVVFQ